MKIYQVGQSMNFYSLFKTNEFKNRFGYKLFNYQLYVSKYMQTLRIAR